MLGAAHGQGPYDLAEIESAIHPDDKPIHVAALNAHLNRGDDYDVQLRLADRNRTYRWYRSRGKAIRDETGRLVRMIGSFSEICDFAADARKS